MITETKFVLQCLKTVESSFKLIIRYTFSSNQAIIIILIPLHLRIWIEIWVQKFMLQYAPLSKRACCIITSKRPGSLCSTTNLLKGVTFSPRIIHANKTCNMVINPPILLRGSSCLLFSFFNPTFWLAIASPWIGPWLINLQ